MDILDPGRFIDGAGPDVRDAVIRIGSTIHCGDVEFHQKSAGWKQHGHHLKPSYNRVILHVVLNHDPRHGDTSTRSGRLVPLLVLAPLLSESIDSLWQAYLKDEDRSSSLACFGKTKHMKEEFLRRWLLAVDRERLELRILRLRERLQELAADPGRKLAEPQREYGVPPGEGYPEDIPSPYPELSRALLTDRRLWDQVLYEGIMEGLGYSRNRIPFIRLARIVSLKLIRSMSLQYDPARLSALMFGVSGLLPALRTMKQSASRRYVRSLHREWSRYRGIASIEHMHAVEWQFSPTRPLNFPTLRISAAPELIRGVLINEMFRRIIQVIKDRTSNRAKLRELQRLFRLEPDEYWGRHYNFDRRASTVVRALGLSRVNDILANTIFPLSLLYARVFRDTRVRNGAHSLRSEFPTLSENSSTRAIRRELFYGKNALTSLPLQQGAIQLYRYYCTKGRCNECDIGKRVF